MDDKRRRIIEAGLSALRASGFGGLTQPRVAALAGLRQSHLTYYFPTRADLVAAVARAAIDRQLAATDQVLRGSTRQAARAITKVAIVPESTRVMMALAQAADEEPAVRAMFRELAAGIVERAGRYLEAETGSTDAEHARMLHALSVGLALINLATGRADGPKRSAAVLDSAFTLIREHAAS